MPSSKEPKLWTTTYQKIKVQQNQTSLRIAIFNTTNATPLIAVMHKASAHSRLVSMMMRRAGEQGEKLIYTNSCSGLNGWQIRDDGCLFVCAATIAPTSACVCLSKVTCERFPIWEDWLCHYGGGAALGWSPLVTLHPLQCRCLSLQDGLPPTHRHRAVHSPACLPVWLVLEQEG